MHESYFLNWNFSSASQTFRLILDMVCSKKYKLMIQKIVFHQFTDS